MVFDNDMNRTDQLIASANTTAGFAIGIVSKTAFRTGHTYFEVVRMDRASRYVTLTRHSDEVAARKAANAAFKADKMAA